MRLTARHRPHIVARVPDRSVPVRTMGRVIAAGLRRSVQATAPTPAGVAFPSGTLSISIGKAGRTFGQNVAESDNRAGRILFRAADQALYIAKARGRNTVHLA